MTTKSDCTAQCDEYAHANNCDSDAALLDALDNACRQIAIRSMGGPEGTMKVFRWQVEMVGPSSLRPSVRDAIRTSLRSPEGVKKL